MALPGSARGEGNSAYEAMLQAALEGKPLDTAAADAEFRKRQEWGQTDERLPEARGRLAFGQGRWLEAMALLQKVSKLSPSSMEILAECWNRKGQKYEAAAWKQKAAQAYGAGHPRYPLLLREYLSIKPNDPAVAAALAGYLAKAGENKEALRLYRSHTGAFAAKEEMALEAGGVFEAEKLDAEASALYAQALEKNPASLPLAKRQAAVLQRLKPDRETAARWQRLWDLFPADTAARNRALESWAAAGDTARYGSLLYRALLQNADAPDLNLIAARGAWKKGDKESARKHAELAAAGSGHCALCAEILSQTATGDEEILTRLPLFLEESRSDKASSDVLLAGARGLALQGKAKEACRLYIRVAAIDSTRPGPEASETLAKCDDPASQAMLARLGVGELATPEALLALARAQRQEKRWPKLGITLEQLAPLNRDAALPMALELAKADPPSALPPLKKLADDGAAEAAETLGLMLAQGRCAEALPYLGMALAAGRKVEAQLGQCQLATGDTLSAQSAFQTLYARTKDPDLLRRIQGIAQGRTDPDGEVWALSALVERRKASVSEKIRLGLLLWDRWERGRAGALLEEALRDKAAAEDPAFGRASLAAGLGAWENRRGTAAKQHLQAAMRLLPDSVAGWRALGQACAALGHWGEAAQAYAAGLERAPEEVDMLDGLVQAAKKSRRPEDVEKAHAAVLKRNSDDPETNRFFADFHLSRKRCPEALPFLRRLTEWNPSDGKTWAAYGNCLAETSDFAAAGMALQNALDNGVEDEEVYLNRARAYRHEGMQDMAESILSYVLGRNPKSEKALALQARFQDPEVKKGGGAEK